MWRVSLTAPSLSLSLPLPSLSPPLLTQGAVIGIDDEDDSTFTITVDQKTFHFQGEPYHFCFRLYSFSLFAAVSSLSGHTRLPSSPVSLAHSPPLRDLDWSTQTPGNDMHGHNVTDVSDQCFFSVDPLQLWSELLLISGDEHESGIHLFNCNPEGKLSSFFCLLLGFSWLWLSRKIASCVPLQSSLESSTLLLLLALCEYFLTTGFAPNFSLVSSSAPASPSVFIEPGSGQPGVQQTPLYSLLLTGF